MEHSATAAIVFSAKPDPTDAKPARSLGRPRDLTVRSRILAATIRLLKEQSVQDITIEGIAREAGVSKATIYRWWNSKTLIVIDAFTDNYVAKTPMLRDRSAGEALALHISSIVQEYAGWTGRVVAQIIAEGQADPEVMRAFRERFHYGRRAVVREMLENWRRDEAIVTPPNIEVLGDLLYAPIYLRLLLGHAPLDKVFVQEHLSYVYTLLKVDLPSWLR